MPNETFAKLNILLIEVNLPYLLLMCYLSADLYAKLDYTTVLLKA